MNMVAGGAHWLLIEVKSDDVGNWASSFHVDGVQPSSPSAAAYATDST
ncbi:MAG TPA: hypothetical protein VF086_02845 [Propionibacteriaceae bacterium]